MNVFRTLKLPDLFSLLNASFGFCAILSASRGMFILTVMLVFLSAAADGLDGLLARKVGASVLGANLDSLADLISFGAAPAVLSLEAFGGSWAALAVALAYLICGTLRLARFNITPRNDRSFEGLPITASGIAATASVLAGRQDFTLLLMVVLSAFMVSSVPIPKVRDARATMTFAMALLISSSLMWYRWEASYLLMLLALTAYLASPVVMPYLRRER